VHLPDQVFEFTFPKDLAGERCALIQRRGSGATGNPALLAYSVPPDRVFILTQFAMVATPPGAAFINEMAAWVAMPGETFLYYLAFNQDINTATPAVGETMYWSENLSGLWLPPTAGLYFRANPSAGAGGTTDWALWGLSFPRGNVQLA
jgi:hypothetical protein